MKKKGDKVTERNTLQFRLKIRCKRNKKAPSDTTNPDELYLNSKVYTRTIEWEPIGDQKNWIPGSFGKILPDCSSFLSTSDVVSKAHLENKVLFQAEYGTLLWFRYEITRKLLDLNR